MNITRIKIQNFRCIKELQLDFSNYNVFVGKNNAGKSNILDAIRIACDPSIKFTSTDVGPESTDSKISITLDNGQEFNVIGAYPVGKKPKTSGERCNLLIPVFYSSEGTLDESSTKKGHLSQIQSLIISQLSEPQREIILKTINTSLEALKVIEISQLINVELGGWENIKVNLSTSVTRDGDEFPLTFLDKLVDVSVLEDSNTRGVERQLGLPVGDNYDCRFGLNFLNCLQPL